MPSLVNRFATAVVTKLMTFGKTAGLAFTNFNGSVALINLGAEILTAARTLLRTDSGKTFFLNLAGGFAVTLPLPELGLRVRCIVMTAPTTAYTIVTAGSANIMKGHVLTVDVNSVTDPDFETSGGDTFTFVANKAVAGDWVEFVSDGTSWHTSARISVFDGATITTAS